MRTILRLPPIRFERKSDRFFFYIPPPLCVFSVRSPHAEKKKICFFPVFNFQTDVLPEWRKPRVCFKLKTLYYKSLTPYSNNNLYYSRCAQTQTCICRRVTIFWAQFNSITLFLHLKVRRSIYIFFFLILHNYFWRHDLIIAQRRAQNWKTSR